MKGMRGIDRNKAVLFRPYRAAEICWHRFPGLQPGLSHDGLSAQRTNVSARQAAWLQWVWAMLGTMAMYE
jgi:hypothetical protein